MKRPIVELAFAVVVMLGGAWLVGWWAVGVVLVLLGVLLGADAVLRDDDARVDKSQLSNEVLERWRRAR